MMVLNRFEREWDDYNFKVYLIDLLSYREVSNAITDIFEVEHQSLQILLIKITVFFINLITPLALKI